MARQYFDENYDEFLSHAENKSKDLKYGLPDQKKFPMPDRSHVLSAIKFFNYVSPKDEETLAHAILARMKEYGIDEVNVGPDNRFRKYYEKTELKHYRTPGSKNGVRLYQYPDGTWTELGKERRRIGENSQDRGEKSKGRYKVSKSSDVKASDNDKDEELTKRIHDIYEAANIVNTDEHGIYHNGNPRYNNNCWSCCIAYELRRRGIPAKSFKTNKGMDPAVLRKAFNIEPFSFDNVVFPIETNEKIDALMKMYKTDSVDSVMRLLTVKQRNKLLSARISSDDVDGIINSIVKQGDGARGMINFRRVNGSGHIFNYEIISNKAIIIDAQMQGVAPASKVLGMLLKDASLVDFFRTDNVELSASIDKYYQREGARI